MKRLSGFSLMEMMVVLLITAIVAAATAPIVSKKMVSEAGSGESPWMWVGTKRSIVYNVDGNENKTANIGGLASDKARLYIQTKGQIPQIAFKGAGSSVMRLLASGGSISFTDSIANENLPAFSVTIGERAVPGVASVTIGSTVSGPSATSANNMSVAVGFGSVSKNYSTALGAYSTAESSNSTAIGSSSKAEGYGTALGASANVIGACGTAIGFNSKSKEYGLALGYKSDAGIRSLAVGASSNATGTDALAIGYGAQAMKTGCVGIVTGGSSYGASANYSTAYGYQASAKGSYSTAIGCQAKANSTSSIAIGDEAKAGQYSVCIGSEIPAESAEEAVAIGGNGETRVANYGVAVGSSAKAIGTYSTAVGNGARAENSRSIALGHSANAGGSYSTALGSGANAGGSYSTALGYGSNAIGMYNIAIGYGATTQLGSGSAANAIAIGHGATAGYTNSIAIGNGAKAKGPNQIVLGDPNTVVYIPGTLAVAKDTYLGINGGNVDTYINMDHEGSDGHGIKVIWQRLDNDLRATPDRDNTHGNVTKFIDSHNLSDRRLKNVGDAFKGGLAELKKLELFNFTFKKDPNKTPMVGVMAQDLQKVFPNAVMKGDDGFLRIRWDEMFFSMINAIKELDIRVFNNSKKIEALEKQNTELQKKIDKLEQRLDKLEKKCK